MVPFDTPKSLSLGLASLKISKTINPKTSSQMRIASVFVHPQVTSILMFFWVYYLNVGERWGWRPHVFYQQKCGSQQKWLYIVFIGVLLHTMSVMSKNGVFLPFQKNRISPSTTGRSKVAGIFGGNYPPVVNHGWNFPYLSMILPAINLHVSSLSPIFIDGKIIYTLYLNYN